MMADDTQKNGSYPRVGERSEFRQDHIFRDTYTAYTGIVFGIFISYTFWYYSVFKQAGICVFNERKQCAEVSGIQLGFNPSTFE